MAVPKIKMNNGLYMPAIGLGTFRSLGGDAGNATQVACDFGYRHYDTAYLYENEKEVGDALNEKLNQQSIKREDLFVVTKLWNTFHEPDKVEKWCRKQLEYLGLGYIDLYLMHYPVGFVERDPFDFWPMQSDGTYEMNDIDYIDTWRAMESLVNKGLVKSIGVSNFNSQQIDRLLKNCSIKPVTNQIEVSPGINQKKLIKFCKERDIIVTAYCPLGRPDFAAKKPNYLFDDKVKAIGDKYGKTAAQVILRYLVEIGTVPIPKSVTPKRIEENILIFDFKLTDDEIKYMDTFNCNERVIHFKEATNNKYFPFNIEF